MENNFYDISSDASSDKTIILDFDPLDSAIKNNKPSTSKSADKNFYSLDEFDDIVISEEPLIERIKASNLNRKESSLKTCQSNDSWQTKFTTDDFCEDSNDFDAVLYRISQLEADKPKRPELSKEVQTLIEGSSPLGFNFNTKLNENHFDVVSDGSSLEEQSEPLVPVKKLKTKKSTAEKTNEKLEKELTKAAKVREREQKKLEKENEKQLKNALRVIDSCTKPDQCIQYMIVNIDDSIDAKSYSKVIKTGLKNEGYTYRVSKQVVPNVISWTRKVPSLKNMLLQNTEQLEKKYLLIMDTPDFINHIANDTLIAHIQSLIHMPQIEHLTVAILGLPRYYKYLRNEKNRDFKALVAETSSNKTKNVEFKDLPDIQKKEIEKTLVELQIFCKNIYVRLVERYEDLAVFVAECSKSVALIPYKLARSESFQQQNEFFAINNRDCIKVDSHGNGLGRLWNQFLRMFPLVNLETAEAITSAYPTMNALIQAYKQCETPEEGEKMLQDLPVRRAAGPLGAQRRLGPELSKKVYKFFYSTENILL
ncbi:crossover junction endonuclease EME1 [Anthonomus grandis grandis]|uniref:crossover junction endonuclease EME1 n=1 Tax=Anthonomus grandis grandis TaxID=2921223 RepID=UPI0021656B53|nr:crossover junction endonuclease EME1 [Anthonomus grandis grandis]XP_050293507.1 crossover junction endonuclease EME1 [Anthonomus grandis grandis]XP_050293508.1 crossover junction endonuclease EME1 [Anthonomus grandis grandis]